jgi:hypothetical protein
MCVGVMALGADPCRGYTLKGEVSSVSLAGARLAGAVLLRIVENSNHERNLGFLDY